MLECCEIFRGVPITPLLHDSNTTIFQRGCGSAAECGRAKAETMVRFRSPAPFLSLWCSPDNMPASHAGDHRSEAGQGRQFHCPQSILSDALLWYGNQLGATPGGGSNFVAVAVRQHRSRASAQAGFIRPLCPGQHWGLRPAFASSSYGWQAIYRLLAAACGFLL